MRCLANENFPLSSVHLLRQAGYDVTSIIQEMPGATDHEVLARASREKRIVLTFDRDYGALVYRMRSPVPSGIVLFRFDPQTPEEPAQWLLRVLQQPGLFLEGKFTVIERERVRQRPL
ncbi:DUF5615 family PIN-like protein [Rhodothermus marinus]|jgi:predicted nuclease of predicted toxin-antitoxin system|uniref:DUF5615 domain-containing protein n=1 Tax=Rhodothermus marinus (strain ATCC 43812 / DSM 4252 / R-10) TaxID=518766 RepID=D0MJW3_RHOM4|nr:DUF5615 family PIN-like protein [Rhodothermus marinus]ACY48771.1 conserved hypothetical protein [Rhodothermus marinus DSM 4252]MBO2491620.1 hypothetical protein [Rhodothermus marinus]